MSETNQNYNIEPIVISEESTVVAEYKFDEVREESYQTEAQLEESFIEQLEKQSYEYLPIKSKNDLKINLRKQLEKLNNVIFSDKEWSNFFTTCISSANDGIVEKTNRIQKDHIQLLKRDDGTLKNIRLIDKSNIHNNSLQVINQYQAVGNQKNRYDVTVLVNGLPLVHIELKRRGVDIREAFNQINRYQRDSFWSGSGLYEYIQLFVISNGTLTKYYSNTVRESHLSEQRKKTSTKKTSNSFSFTSWWADAHNKQITELKDFTKTFFAKHTILNILTRYCVFDVDRKLLVMRPYQIAATEQILQRILVATNNKLSGTTDAGGYIWHTTGSGKTLTSFKTAQLAKDISGIDKVLFVVDRKDLDYQTMREYERFEKGAANSNISTKVLTRQLGDDNTNIIITTIQKLSRFVDSNKNHPIYKANIVIIFDECHRSQFGDMHKKITKSFKHYYLFGFTGTPIFAQNANNNRKQYIKTTEQAFGAKLHSYTIVNAINDKNVLPFRIDYIDTIKQSSDVSDKKVLAINTKDALLAPERIKEIVKYIREHFAQKTKQAKGYNHSVVTNVKDVSKSKNKVKPKIQIIRKIGFNSLFATDSIEAAKKYYQEFANQQKGFSPDQRLKIGIIYSFVANNDEEEYETDRLDKKSKDFLDLAIKDYNKTFKTNYDTSTDKFQNYYKDLSQRIKNQEIDIVIVVGMFLTGFDATTLNTLWVDKSLKSHGLIQAFSRTNRILNSVKTYGNIISFRNLYKETNDALALFGNKDAKGIVLLKPYSEYYDEFEQKINELINKFSLPCTISSEALQKEFIKLFGSILRLKNILTSYDDFVEDKIISKRDFQDYQSLYLNLYTDFRNTSTVEKESINDDVVFEIELIKQVEINVDYILMLVEKYLNCKCDKEANEIKENINRSVNSSLYLRNKKDLIEQFISSISLKANVSSEWIAFMNKKKEEEFNQIITDEKLNLAQAKKFIEKAFRDGYVSSTGTEIANILPKVSRFNKNNQYSEKKQIIIEKLNTFFDRFFGMM